MKILQIIDSLPATSGGARFVVNLAKSLKIGGISTDVLLIDGKHSHFLQELLDANIKVVSLDLETSSRYKIKYLQMIAKVSQEYDIIHVHIFPTSYLVAIASLIFKKKVPIVFTEHNSFNRRASHFAFKFIEKIIYSRFYKIICLSDQVYRFVKRNLNVKDDKLLIVENAIDLKAVQKTKPYSKRELGFLESDFLLLMSARLDNQKNHKVLLDTMIRLPKEVKLLLAGDGSLRRELEQYSETLGINDRVKFLGSRQDVFSLLKSVDVNLLVSNFEGLSLAALEAMASGKPFIASDVEGLDFVVNDSRLLFKNTPKELVSVILQLKEDKRWYDEVCEISSNRVEYFDFVKMTNKYIQIYKEVLKSK